MVHSIYINLENVVAGLLDLATCVTGFRALLSCQNHFWCLLRLLQLLLKP
jgi:hypothetical protein